MISLYGYRMNESADEWDMMGNEGAHPYPPMLSLFSLMSTTMTLPPLTQEKGEEREEYGAM